MHGGKSGLAAEALVARSKPDRGQRESNFSPVSTSTVTATLPVSSVPYWAMLAPVSNKSNEVVGAPAPSEPAPTKSAQTAPSSTEEILSVPAVTEVTTAARSQVHGNVMALKCDDLSSDSQGSFVCNMRISGIMSFMEARVLSLDF
ncbi:hypothetical protein PENFLA_c028G07927 [Penicillium flavigenum]|uniref:Uncharacterized protein n=1 Tax=Penicillium flavigenum TaxID=254877 RepID=A0A1V6SQC8_9EURO|nr:hypothetical protein PENFLA_c028G07927 [Penicillium flavigenum]